MPSQKLRRKKNFAPCEALENDEVYNLGIFQFNISRISEHIQKGILAAEQEDVDVVKWYHQHCTSKVNETHLPTVDTSKPVIQAEISPGKFEIIDGNHRLEKAYRNHIHFISSFKILAKQLVNYFTEENGYIAFVDYWNQKLKDI